MKKNILFVTSVRVESILDKFVYTDLINEFVKNDHNVFVVSPFERRLKKKTKLYQDKSLTILNVRTLNLQKINFFEKTISTFYIWVQFKKAIDKYLCDINFDLIIYTTPPITFYRLIKYLKHKHNSTTYLLLKDIFPQNAIDLEFFSKKSLAYKIFRKIERKLYIISDFIGCMSQANKEYLIKHNSYLDKSKIEINPNCITPNKTNHISDDYILKELKINIREESLIFLYGGNLGKPQGLGFLKTILLKNKNDFNFFFIIIGDGTEYLTLKRFIEFNNIENVMLSAKIEKIKYDQLIKYCDIGLIFLNKNFTIPNFPFRLLGYLENKMPVISCTDMNTDIGEVLVKNRCGFKILSGDIELFQDVINQLLNNKKLVEDYGDNAYKLLINEYGVKKSYDLIIEKLIQ
ncbi:glycosyltransferase family 4 protein [Flavobacteriaceae bacterium]|nr:glycosyltransferase family 4 protein [Flavobacteriaceae bacterium]